MIVLDTNVISEPLRRVPDLGVLDWLGQPSEQFALSAVSVGELLTGVRLLPVGHRREAIAVAIEDLLGSFEGAVLPYDDRSARSFVEISELARNSGRPVGVEDAMIAGICLSHGATLATRNTKDFTGLGIDLVNPWQPSA